MTCTHIVRSIQSSDAQHNNRQDIDMKFFADENDYKTRKNVVAAYPAAAKIVKVCGGWAVFEFFTDYEIWRNQK